ncbi:hypothetical protein CIT292_07653 [Citrobacter youngae ATCC 29220]|uniref:Uncharacterized protein n=1 Tax=Citrobacter youngae ATCC 29220 TaxID=500640 RepID=D4BB06_9ENTR|nr:hypothetical protein CIT292_07653 [Citrobacter youngae ATCC 29220]
MCIFSRHVYNPNALIYTNFNFELYLVHKIMQRKHIFRIYAMTHYFK